MYPSVSVLLAGMFVVCLPADSEDNTGDEGEEEEKEGDKDSGRTSTLLNLLFSRLCSVSKFFLFAPA